MLRRSVSLLVLAVLALVTVLAPRTRAADAPRPAPAIVVKTAHGAVALDSLRGKVVLVDFWASWCGPCHRSFPWLDAMQKKFKDQGLVVLAIDVDKDLDAADRFLAQHPSTCTIAYDPAGKAAEAFDVKGMPSTYLVGRDGLVRVRHVGFEPGKTAALETALQEACAR